MSRKFFQSRAKEEKKIASKTTQFNEGKCSSFSFFRIFLRRNSTKIHPWEKSSSHHHRDGRRATGASPPCCSARNFSVVLSMRDAAADWRPIRKERRKNGEFSDAPAHFIDPKFFTIESFAKFVAASEPRTAGTTRRDTHL